MTTVVGWGLRVGTDLDADGAAARVAGSTDGGADGPGGSAPAPTVAAAPAPIPFLPGLGPRRWVRADDGDRYDPACRVRRAVAACDDAVRTVGGDLDAIAPPDRRALVVQTEFGSESVVAAAQLALLTSRPPRVSPTLFSRSVDNHLLGELARHFACRGPAVVVAGAAAVDAARSLLAAGRADVVLVVGGDDLSGPLSLLVGAAGGSADDVLPAEVSGALCLVRDAQGTGALRLAGTAQRRRRSDVPYACDPTALARVLTEHAGPEEVLVLLAASTARGVAAEDAVVVRTLGPGATRVAPWCVLGEPFGGKEVGGIALACAAASADGAASSRGVLALATDGAGTCRVTALVPGAPPD